jgi:hypothetical protein
MAGLLLALIIAAQAAPAAPLDDIGKALDTLAAEGPEQAGDSAGILTIPDNPAAPGFVVPPPPTRAPSSSTAPHVNRLSPRCALV